MYRKDYSDPKIQRHLRQVRLSSESQKKAMPTFANYVGLLVNVPFSEKPNCGLSHLSNPKADFIEAALECPSQKEIFKNLDFIQKEISKDHDIRWLSSCLVQKDNKHYLQLLFKCKQTQLNKHMGFLEKILGSTPKKTSLQFI